MGPLMVQLDPYLVISTQLPKVLFGWGSILMAQYLLNGMKPISRNNKISMEPHSLHTLKVKINMHAGDAT